MSRNDRGAPSAVSLKFQSNDKENAEPEFTTVHRDRIFVGQLKGRVSIKSPYISRGWGSKISRGATGTTGCALGSPKFTWMTITGCTLIL